MHEPTIISVDDHLIEPPDLWTSQAPPSLRDAVPQVITDPQTGAQHWEFDGRHLPMSGLMTCSGRPRDEWSPVPLHSYDEMPEGYHDPVARCQVMDEDGVLASLAFPTIPRFCGQIFSEVDDRELGMASLQMYNDWIIDRWCADSNGRLIPMMVVPLWDPARAAEEVYRCAGRGVRALNFTENPHELGWPSIHNRDRHWDPLWSAVNEVEIPVCMHIGSSSIMTVTAPDAPFLVASSLVSLNTQKALTDWLFSGLFVRFPNLQIVLSEGGIGWMPALLERTEWVLDRQRWAVKSNMTLEGELLSDEDMTDVLSSPRKLFSEHVYGCVIDDQHGIDSIDKIGEDRILMETDYPHSDSTWPHSLKIAQERLRHLPQETQDKLMFGNAAKLFKLDLDQLRATVR